MPAAAQISHLEKFVRHFAALNPAEAEATLVSELLESNIVVKEDSLNAN
jgi:hypothetical protein